MARLLEIKPDIRPYLAALIVRAVQRAGDRLIVPSTLPIEKMTEEDFDYYQLGLAARSYNAYGVL